MERLYSPTRKEIDCKMANDAKAEPRNSLRRRENEIQVFPPTSQRRFGQLHEESVILKEHEYLHSLYETRNCHWEWIERREEKRRGIVL